MEPFPRSCDCASTLLQDAVRPLHLKCLTRLETVFLSILASWRSLFVRTFRPHRRKEVARVGAGGIPLSLDPGQYESEIRTNRRPPLVTHARRHLLNFLWIWMELRFDLVKAVRATSKPMTDKHSTKRSTGISKDPSPTKYRCLA